MSLARAVHYVVSAWALDDAPRWKTDSKIPWEVDVRVCNAVGGLTIDFRIDHAEMWFCVEDAVETGFHLRMPNFDFDSTH